jgi:transcriptional regulator with XRE-family HTH domain
MSAALRKQRSPKSPLKPQPNPAIGEFIRQSREEAGLTEAAVVDYLGDISVETLKAYECGERSIPLNHLYALSNCLNVSPSAIVSLITRYYK